MKTLTLADFTASLPTAVDGVAIGGDVLRVETEKGGAFVVLSASEFKVVIDALRGLFAVSAAFASKSTINEMEFERLLEAVGGGD